MIPDKHERAKIHVQLDAFKVKKGLFGSEVALMTKDVKTPAMWWDSYGAEFPELQRFAIRILSLTCSSSGCERNWSAFEMVHTKRRNCLHQKKMNDLVFVMYNLKLKERQVKKSIELDDFEDLPSDDEWIANEEENGNENTCEGKDDDEEGDFVLQDGDEGVDGEGDNGNDGEDMLLDVAQFHEEEDEDEDEDEDELEDVQHVQDHEFY